METVNKLTEAAIVGIHEARLLACLRLTQRKVGLLLNDCVESWRTGIRSRRSFVSPCPPRASVVNLYLL
jgi:hypothetical protein